jgi:excisionase family DNA binding protein
MSMNVNGRTLYDLKEVSSMLQVTERTLYTYLKDKKLRGQIIGRKWYVSSANLDDFINGASA